MKFLRTALVHGERRGSFYGVVLGVWLIIALYAILHDQYLVRIAPEHFTVYHLNELEISNPRLLAAYLALKASVSPGLFLGLAAWLAGRAGSRPKLAPRQIFCAVGLVVVVTELLALLAGGWVHFARVPLYPRGLYPELTLPLMTTQTIQLTCYLAAFLCSAAMLVWMVRKRRA